MVKFTKNYVFDTKSFLLAGKKNEHKEKCSAFKINVNIQTEGYPKPTRSSYYANEVAIFK